MIAPGRQVTCLEMRIILSHNDSKTFIEAPSLHSHFCNRRNAMRSAFVAILAASNRLYALPNSLATATPGSDRQRGLLLGGLIGDAIGGPIEFSDSPRLKTLLCNARDWRNDETVTPDRLKQLSQTVPLLDYRALRPSPAPYGQWKEDAQAGTLTDDSRHKIVLLRAMARSNQENRALSKLDIAKGFLSFKASPSRGDSAEIEALNDEGFREYRLASRWMLGERDLRVARPVERLWAGVNNCSGQMMFPPLAACYPGNPIDAYRATYELDFIDSPMARDMASALVAGLAAALAEDLDKASPKDRIEVMLAAIRETDPYGYADVPFAGRQLSKWLSKSDELVDRSSGSPKTLFRLLETEGKPVYWWDAHFTLLVPLSILALCNYDPLAAMHLTLDFGHDTDSYAQVLGCIIGAAWGTSVFPDKMVTAVEKTLSEDYEENVDSWLVALSDARNL